MLKIALVLVTLAAALTACKPNGWSENWYESQVSQWSKQVSGSEPEGYTCRTYGNYNYAECDVSVKGQVYPLACHFRYGCEIRYRRF